MKNYFIRLLLCIVFLPSGTMAQETGVKFEMGLSWQAVKEKAKLENKLIFVDCYASWCGPCKFMDQQIYPDKETAEFFNSHFINFKLQLDKTSKDDPSIRALYHTADSLSRIYKITFYPTFLFFTVDGQPLHQFAGASETAKGFIERASAALDPNKQYFTLIKDWKIHETDTSYLVRTISAAKDAGDDNNARLIANKYATGLQAPFAKDQIQVIGNYVLSESDAGFNLILKHAGQIDKLFGKPYAEEVLTPVIFNEELSGLLERTTVVNWKALSHQVEDKYLTLDRRIFDKRLEIYFQKVVGKEIDRRSEKNELGMQEWQRIDRQIKNKYPDYDCGQIVMFRRFFYYYDRKNWDLCSKSAVSLIDKYRDHITPTTINDIIWRSIFLHSDDQQILNKALGYMEDVLKATPESNEHTDTYANLLYKTGHKEQAILWENKALDLCSKYGFNPQENKETLEKMQKGEPTWTSNAKN